MVVTSTSNSKKLYARLVAAYSSFGFEAGNSFCWQPEENKIYTNFKDYSPREYWSFIHEIGHAVLGHKTFPSDFDLLLLEVDAWEKAKKIAEGFHLEIEQDYIQDCLDEYRDWLHQRSLCPTCNLTGVQISTKTYRCINCSNKWQVTMAHMHRPYRKNKTTST